MLEALRQGIGRHQRRAFWEATIAVCALVAAPEGKVSFATRVRIDNILDNLPDLRVFDANEFVEYFDRFVEEFRVSPKKARARALDVARKGANDIDDAELLARIAMAVADTDPAADIVELEPIKALCGELGVDPISVLAAATTRDDTHEAAATPITPDEPAAPPVESAPPTASATPPAVEKLSEEQSEMPEDDMAGDELEVVAIRSTSATAREPETREPENEPEPAMSSAPAVNQNSAEADLSQQLLVDGTTAVIALCGRNKAGSLEALRIYENEQIAEADRALSEKITNEPFWLSPVTLFPSSQTRDSGGDDGEPTPIHVMCLSRPDGSVEALRAFESADQASADLEFFRNLSNDKMWVSVVQFKTVS